MKLRQCFLPYLWHPFTSVHKIGIALFTERVSNHLLNSKGEAKLLMYSFWRIIQMLCLATQFNWKQNHWKQNKMNKTKGKKDSLSMKKEDFILNITNWFAQLKTSRYSNMIELLFKAMKIGRNTQKK